MIQDVLCEILQGYDIEIPPFLELKAPWETSELCILLFHSYVSSQVSKWPV